MKGPTAACSPRPNASGRDDAGAYPPSRSERPPEAPRLPIDRQQISAGYPVTSLLKSPVMVIVAGSQAAAVNAEGQP